jgi:DNA polymerase V
MHYIGLMDCNNFFVSCERLFRPDLLKKPVAVLSSNDGCIVARSQEVKELGIPMGAPYFMVRAICKKEGVTLFSSNFRLYRDISARVMHALCEEVDTFEVYSIDEAFFSIEETVTEEEVLLLRERIMQKTGIPVSFGIARTKTIAKAAGDHAKKESGVSILDATLWETKISEIPCGSIWGIGRQTSAKLTKLGINTVADLISKDITYVRAHFGVVGERMHHELTGTPVYGVREGEEAISQSLTSTRSFQSAVHERSVLESALGYHAAHLGEKLRDRGLAASYIRIITGASRFSDYAQRKGSAAVALTVPTCDTRVLLKEVLGLFNTIYDPEIPYKKAGVSLGGILPQALVSGALFGEEKGSTNKILDRVTDEINLRFGHGTVRPGTVLNIEGWQASARLRSLEYTTKWQELASVKAM